MEVQYMTYNKNSRKKKSYEKLTPNGYLINKIKV